MHETSPPPAPGGAGSCDPMEEDATDDGNESASIKTADDPPAADQMSPCPLEISVWMCQCRQTPRLQMLRQTL
eukprot:2484407-Amphidinium_carterae.1